MSFTLCIHTSCIQVGKFVCVVEYLLQLQFHMNVILLSANQLKYSSNNDAHFCKGCKQFYCAFDY